MRRPDPVGASLGVWAERIRLKARSLNPIPIQLPRYGPAPENPFSIGGAPDRRWFSAVQISAQMIGKLAVRTGSIRAVQQVLSTISSDAYIEYLRDFYRDGLRKHGDAWRFADLTTALWAAATTIHPRRYLEIGVRRGRSLLIVASAIAEVDIVGFDLWIPDYAGMPNPGPTWVRDELARVSHRGKLELVEGDSAVTVPRYLSRNPDLFFDLITVDGDHSARGASLDLLHVLPRLVIGGTIIFDDIVHPKHARLAKVWHRYVASQPRFDAWSFTSLGFGVGIGIRKY